MKEKISNHEFQEFCERMEQLNQFYQEAVMFLALKHIGERQDGQDSPLVTIASFSIRSLGWVRNIFRHLKLLIHKYHPGKSMKPEMTRTRDTTRSSKSVVDLSPLAWHELPPLSPEEDRYRVATTIHPMDQKKGETPNERHY